LLSVDLIFWDNPDYECAKAKDEMIQFKTQGNRNGYFGRNN